MLLHLRHCRRAQRGGNVLLTGRGFLRSRAANCYAAGGKPARALLSSTSAIIGAVVPINQCS